MVSYLREPRQTDIPPYVCIPEAYSSRKGFYQQATYLGARSNPLNAGGNPALGKYRPPEFALAPEMTLERLQHRRELLGAMNGLVQKAAQQGELDAMDKMQQQAFELLTGTRARAAFDLCASRQPCARSTALMLGVNRHCSRGGWSRWASPS